MGITTEIHDGIAEVCDEPLGAHGCGIHDLAAAMPGGVVGVHRAEPGQPRHLPRPRGATAHEAVHQHQRPPGAATVRSVPARHGHVRKRTQG